MTERDERRLRPACPTCGVAFRGALSCTRCGTDLSRLTAVLLEARACREAARCALLENRPDQALAELGRARGLHDTEAGRRLEALALIAADRLREGVRRAAALLLSTPEGADLRAR